MRQPIINNPISNNKAQPAHQAAILTDRTPHDTREDKPQPEQGPEQWGEFLTPEQRRQIVARILATIALRVVRNNQIRDNQMRKGQMGQSHET